MKTKETAIGWFWDHIVLELSEEQINKFTPFLRQGKRINKKQIIDTWDLARRDIDYPANGTKYYNETFKNEES